MSDAARSAEEFALRLLRTVLEGVKAENGVNPPTVTAPLTSVKWPPANGRWLSLRM